MDSRLKTYALTAGSTAALAAAGSAAADIITSSGPTSIIVNAAGTTLFSIDRLDVIALGDTSGNWSTSGSATAVIFGTGVGNMAAQAVNSGATIDTNLKSGKVAGSALNAALFDESSTRASVTYGGLALGTENLIAINLDTDDQNYFGWINFSISRVEGVLTFTINSWAYNDVAGQGIIAGQNTAAGSAVVPGLGGLAALAIGAAGVRTRRQRIA